MKYAKVDGGAILQTVTLHDSKIISIEREGGSKINPRGLMFDLGRGNQSTFSDQDFVDAGWLPHHHDIPEGYQYYGQQFIIEETKINREIIDRTTEEILDLKVREFTAAVQNHLDLAAREWGYDSIISLCSYAADPNPVYSGEALAAVSWRGRVWQHCYDQLELIKTGQREEPESVESFIAELPAIERP